MPALPLRLPPAARPIADGLDRIRAELVLPDGFGAAAHAEAEAAAGVPPEGPDRRDIPLITIDPPGSRDLDQALAIERRGDGYRVLYAIADVGAVVTPGGALDAATRERGVTIYLPDRRIPLHPPVLGEGAASLLPDEDRRALLWTIDLDARGEAVAAGVARAVVRSRRALSYAEAQRSIDAGAPHDETLALLREVGRLRLDRERERGGVSLTVPVQEIVAGDGSYGLRYDAPLEVEDWNAQVSLLTGMCAARIMVDGGVGLFRVLAPALPRDLASLRRSAAALGVQWPEGMSYGEVVRSLDGARPGHAAFAVRATRLFRGAGYAAWRREDGTPPPAHAAIAAVYAHVTAPLRRLADRVANEIVLAQCAGADPPAWALAALPLVPGLMAEAARRERAAERAAIDLVESVLLMPRRGEVFAGTVVDVRDGRATVQLADPAIVAPLDGDATPGERVRVRLVTADPATRAVRFAREDGGLS